MYLYPFYIHDILPPGKVYNITQYMDFHPGGTDELMRAAGKDGTELFDEVMIACV